jgi:hypothetical protein
MLIFRYVPEPEVIRRGAMTFGWGTIRDLQRVYTTVWGRDAYRRRGQPLQGATVALADIVRTLLALAGTDPVGRAIAGELVQALRYTQGVTDATHLMQPIDPAMLHEVAQQWQANHQAIATVLTNRVLSTVGAETFVRLWTEWATYLDLLETAHQLTGRTDVDAFEGIATEVIETAWGQTPERTRQALATERAQRARRTYEMADLISLKTLNTLMRLQPEAIEAALRGGDWCTVLEWAVFAALYGEGRLYQALRVYLDQGVDPDTRTEFWSLVQHYLSTLQMDYRTRRPLEQVDLPTVIRATVAFLEQAEPVAVPAGFDFEAAWMVARQARLRCAEAHLAAIERIYAEQGASGRPPATQAVELYRQAMLAFLDGLDRVGNAQHTLDAVLQAYRVRLVQARCAADTQTPHRYTFWPGPGEAPGQMRTRALHPRQQLYGMEAYAERMFLAGQLTWEALQRREIDTPSVLESYQYHFAFDEAPLFVQEWVAHFGPRRPALFGYAPPATTADNAWIIAQDRWVCSMRGRMLALGADAALWGPVATGYTERLRRLLHDGGSRTHAVMQALEALVDAGDLAGVTRAVSMVNPDDPDGRALQEQPLVTVGVHVHNAQPHVLFETLVHVREIAWPYQARWTVLGSTSSDRAIAHAEHRMALALGMTRLGLTNRQLLKAGQQNRLLPNMPRASDRESFYLTLDDDYVAAPAVLLRTVPILLGARDAAFVQMPLVFRAALEPGHSIGRRMDAASMLTWSAVKAPGFTETGISLPFGTCTLFRMTAGHNAIEATGGFVVDPTTVMAGEDFAHGVVAVLMSHRPAAFAHVRGKWTGGLFLSEGWVVGDGVDFAPGGQRQKTRWAESAIRILCTLWMPHGREVLALPWQTAVGITTILTSALFVSLASVVVHVVVPLLAFTSLPSSVFMTWGLGYAGLSLGLWMALEVTLQRAAGLTLGDVVGRVVMLFYGTAPSYMRGVVRALRGAPEESWLAFKGRHVSTWLRWLMVGLGVFHAAAAVAGLARGAWICALNLFSSGAFLAVWRFQEVAAGNQRDKVAKIARDAQETVWKRWLRRLSYAEATLGQPVHIRRLWPQFLACVWGLGGIAMCLASTAYLVTEASHSGAGPWIWGWAAGTGVFGLAHLHLVFVVSMMMHGVTAQERVHGRFPRANPQRLADRIARHATRRRDRQTHTFSAP